jgi:hypothetical protein
MRNLKKNLKKKQTEEGSWYDENDEDWDCGHPPGQSG